MMQKISLLLRNYLPLNLLALIILFFILQPGNHLNDADIAKIKVGMHMNEVISILGTSITDQGYRVNEIQRGPTTIAIDTYSGGIGYESDLICTKYRLLPQSSWSIQYVVKQLPRNRQKVEGNPNLKVWLGKARCLWVWSNPQGIVIQVMATPVEVIYGWQDIYERLKKVYHFDGWNGLIQGIKEELDSASVKGRPESSWLRELPVE